MNLKSLLITIVISMITGISVLGIVRYNQKKLAVVDAIQLYNSYHMKIELEKDAEKKLKVLADQADSFKNILTVSGQDQSIPRDQIELLYRQFNQAQHNLEQTYQATSQNINEQVWKRLNPLVDDFAKKKKLRLIVGANGMGSVLYFNDFYDHTKELIEYVNEKYQSGN